MKRTLRCSALLLSCLLAFPISSLAQTRKKPKHTPPPELNETELPAFAVSLVISLANDARSYPDLALRPRVLARCADVIWDADQVTARSLFKRAWEAAEKGDADEVTIKKGNAPEMVQAMRRLSGRDLRLEVLTLISRRDRELSEELFAKLKNEGEVEESKNKQPSNDPWFVTDAISKRLNVARALLEDGDTQRALEFASPVLNYVNVHTITFLSELRRKDAAAADRAFMMLMGRAEADPRSDANTVSGLSSYVFTPGFFVTFLPEGYTRRTEPDEPPVPPAGLPDAVRDRFFELAASILLRPVPPKEHGVAGRVEKLNVIKRLLPLFDRHAPETAAALRAQLTELASYSDPSTSESAMLTRGIAPEPAADDVLETMQKIIDRAKTPAERDQIYRSAASTLLSQGDVRARDIADKIEDAELRTAVSQYVDFEFVQREIRKKAPAEALRLAQTGKLSNTQRAAAYIDIARLFRERDAQRSSELLEAAVREIRRIESENKPDRAVLLIGVVNQWVVADRVRAWEIMDEAVREANRLEGFTGETQIMFSFLTRGGFRSISIGGENFSLTKAISALTKEDMYRAIDLSKSLKYDTARSTATLAVARTILQKK